MRCTLNLLKNTITLCFKGTPCLVAAHAPSSNLACWSKPYPESTLCCACILSTHNALLRATLANMQPAPYPPAYPGQGLSNSMQQPFPQGYPGQQQPLNPQQQQFGMQPSQAATAASQSYPQGQFQAPQQMSMQASMQAVPGAFLAGQAPGAMQPQQYPGNQGQPGMQGMQGPGVGQSAAFPGGIQHSQQLAMSQQGPPLGASHDPMHPLSAQGSVPNSAQLPQMMMGPGGQMVPAGPGSVMGSQPVRWQGCTAVQTHHEVTTVYHRFFLEAVSWLAGPTLRKLESLIIP